MRVQLYVKTKAERVPVEKVMNDTGDFYLYDWVEVPDEMVLMPLDNTPEELAVYMRNIGNSALRVWGVAQFLVDAFSLHGSRYIRREVSDDEATDVA